MWAGYGEWWLYSREQCRGCNWYLIKPALTTRSSRRSKMSNESDSRKFGIYSCVSVNRIAKKTKYSFVVDKMQKVNFIFNEWWRHMVRGTCSQIFKTWARDQFSKKETINFPLNSRFILPSLTGPNVTDLLLSRSRSARNELYLLLTRVCYRYSWCFNNFSSSSASR